MTVTEQVNWHIIDGWGSKCCCSFVHRKYKQWVIYLFQVYM